MFTLRKLFSGTSLTGSPWTLSAVCPYSGSLSPHPFGDPSLHSAALSFLRSSLHSSQEHSFRTTALASPKVSFAYFPVSVSLGSPSFIPLPEFSQVNLLSLQSQSL